ncbi:unannotated protein [freshwater metagenome]|uniref:Unannotated protein n=1 Tax=freshwater metagenome TaxID=449393 RepID=A0A6J6U7C1_9ZZZZ
MKPGNLDIGLIIKVAQEIAPTPTTTRNREPNFELITSLLTRTAKTAPTRISQNRAGAPKNANFVGQSLPG